MNDVSETVLNTSHDKIDPPHQEQKTEPKSELVELGKVSDTRGGWLGSKYDAGAGFTVY
ncbi:MAG: hypothetical protein HIU85_11940 [Proteobacteria bacterium]|nr:hypothetical protein [Pseudomonadota bacterium]